ncbi:MAG TPA: hypothetical protein VJ437_11105 [Acidiferrobacterales bacterium]|nr:hypothetical protein [Acidiferrobacterales bacterium]
MTEETEPPAILSFLRREIFHTTSCDGLRGIFNAGAILPNHGQFNYTHGTDYSYGAAQRCVCLFDFETPSEDECIRTHDRWSTMLRAHHPVTVAILLRHVAIRPQLIPNKCAIEANQPDAIYVPHVEVWSKEPVPITAIVGYIVICPVIEDVFCAHPTTRDPTLDLAAINSVAAEFQQRYAKEYRRADEWKAAHGSDST